MSKNNYKKNSADIQASLKNAIKKLGKNDWYLTLHYYRFSKTLKWIIDKVSAGGHGLEIGVWPGYLGLALQNLGFKETGVDLNPKRLNNLGFPILKINLNYDKMPFTDNYFDFITLLEVIEHMESKQAQKVLRDIHRVLRPNGYLFVTTPNKFRLGEILNKKNTGTDKFGHGHEHEYGLLEIIKLSKLCGFEITEANYISFYSEVGKIKHNKYFYPLINFFSYKNKKGNALKILAYPILKYIPQMRDSIYLILKKN